MKNALISILLLVFLSGCGQARITFSNGTTISFNTSAESQALADIATCPSGMTLIPSGTGVAAFCIDNTASATTTTISHNAASNSCTSQFKSLCSSTQLKTACDSNALNQSYSYWTTDMSGGNSYAVNIAFDAANCGNYGGSNQSIDLSTSVTESYYCCSR